jgi:hypothetical protein
MGGIAERIENGRHRFLADPARSDREAARLEAGRPHRFRGLSHPGLVWFLHSALLAAVASAGKKRAAP